MAETTWDGVSYLSTGYIDIDPNGNITFPDISGETDVDSYIDNGAANAYRIGQGPDMRAALDHFQTYEVPIPCGLGQLSSIIMPGWQARLAEEVVGNGGSLLAARLTCEGTHHIFGIPTLFRYHLYVLYDQLPLLVGVALILAIFIIARDPSAPQRLADVLNNYSPAGAVHGATSALLLFGAIGAIFIVGLYLVEKGIAAPGQTPALPSLPSFTGISAPAPQVQVSAPVGDARVTAGIGGRAPSGGTRSRRGR